MTEDEFSFYSNDKDIKGEKKNKINIYQDKSKEDIKFIPSLEMPKEVKKRNFTPTLEMSKKVKKRNFTPSLEMSKEVKQRNFTPSLEMPKEVKKRNFTPSLEMPKKKGINKIEPPKLKPNYTPKNKIEQPHFKPNYKPQNKIQPHKFKPNYTPINKIEPPKLSPNYQPKNKIQLPVLRANNTPKHKINIINSIQDIKDEKLNPNQIKGEIRNFDWKNVSNNWVIKYNNKEIQLDPTKDPSKENPLYRHKDWLSTVYNNETWNLTDTQLAKISGISHQTICRWRRKYCILTKPRYYKQSLYFDGKNKECGKCHQIKPITEYAERVMREKRILRSICNSCKVENKQIYQFNNKRKVVQNIYNRKLKGKCQECSIGVEYLPVLEFHHFNTELKIKKRINFNRNWKKIKQQLEKEKVTILCGNCHSKDVSKIYYKYKEIIQRKSFGPYTTNKEIKTYVKSHISNPNHYNRVVQLIKKKEVINQLYGGKCIACGKITANENLPALHFHHRGGNNLHPGSETFNAIKNKEFSLMKKQLEEENCIPICGNCHKMERTFHFKNHYEEIVNPKYWNQIKEFYEAIEDNIKKFKFK